MLKRVTSIILFLFLVLMFTAGTVLAAPEFTGNTDPDDPNVVMLIDGNSGKLLHTNGHEDDQVYPASTTKIMTCILALEKGNLSDTVTVSRNAAGQGGQALHIVEDEEIVLEDLLSATMMWSGNDAATAIAEHIAGSVEDFVSMMNQKAQELGMNSTNFANASGLHDDNHVVTGSDMAILARYAMQNETFRKIVNRSEYTIPRTNKRSEQTYDNTNHLMLKEEEPDDYYEYANGIKTGDTPKAGRCLVASATKNDMNLICLIYGDEGNDDRWSLAKELFDWGFDNYETVDVSSLIESVEPVQVQVENYAPTDTGEGLLEFRKPDAASVYITLEKDDAQALIDGTDEITATPSFDVELPLKAPINEGDVLGTVTYSSKATGEELFTDNLVAARNVFETGSSGGTAVATMPPAAPEKVEPEGSGGVWFWLLIPTALIAFLIIRVLTVRRSKSRFKRRHKPHYSYKIKK